MAHWYGHECAELRSVVQNAAPELRRCANCGTSNARVAFTLDTPLGTDGEQHHVGAALLCHKSACNEAFTRNVATLNALAHVGASASASPSSSDAQQQRAALASLVSGPSTRAHAPAALAAPSDTDDDNDNDATAHVEETLSGVVRRRTHQLFGGVVAWDERQTHRSFARTTTVLMAIDRHERLGVLRRVMALAGRAGRELYDLRVHTLTRVAVFVPPTLDDTPHDEAGALELLRTWTVYSPGAIAYSSLSASLSRIEVRSVNNTPITVCLVLDGDRRGALKVRLGATGEFRTIDDVHTLANGQVSLLA
jgi:hypothetical protein